MDKIDQTYLFELGQLIDLLDFNRDNSKIIKSIEFLLKLIKNE